VDRLLRNNLVLRIIALVLSCIIWVTVTLQDNVSGTNVIDSAEKFPRPVHVLVDPNLVVTSIDTPTAVISVQSDIVQAMSLSARMFNVTVQADARGLGPGRHLVPLTAVGMPPVNYAIDPSAVSVVIDRKTTETKGVSVRVEGNPQKGYAVGTPVTDLQTVQVSGVKSAVDQVASVEALIEIDGANQSVTQVVNLRPVDKNGRVVTGVDVNPVTAMVTVPIQSPRLVASVVPQIVGNPVAGYAVAGVEVSPSVVRAFGTGAATSDGMTIQVPVDVSGLRATQTMEVELPLRPGLTELVPGKVAVTVKIESAATKMFEGVPISVKNAPQNTRVEIHGSKTVNVTVSGPKSIVDPLQPADISAYIDATNLKPGTSSVPVNVVLPNWVQATEVSLHSVQVTVTAG
jgi:YbbR domain-containing protein